ncbi:hypothetical protein BH18ACT5_BH18ACT5_08150 [soil metagenome]
MSETGDRRWLWVLLATAAVAIGLLVWLLGLRPGVRVEAPPEFIPLNGTLEFPVGEAIGTVETRQGPLEVFAGLPTSEKVPAGLIGHEQPLVAGEPRWDTDLGAGQVPLAYLGDLRQRAVFVHGIQRPFVDQLQAMEVPDGLCMTLGDTELATGGAGVCLAGSAMRSGIVNVGRFLRDGGVAESAYAAWFFLAPETSVVLLTFADGRSIWQRPVSSSVVMDLVGIPLEPFTMRALDSKAELIELELIDPRAWLP